MGKVKTGFMVHREHYESVRDLEPEQKAALFDAIFCYKYEPLPPMDKETARAFRFFQKQRDIDDNNYKEMCDKRSAAGKKGGRGHKANEANESKESNCFMRNQNEANEPKQSHKDKEKDKDNDKDNDKDRKSTRKFTPPTAKEVQEYIDQEHFEYVNAERFVDFYQSKGWRIGNNTMKDWKAAIRNWNSRGKEGKQTDKKPTTSRSNTPKNKFTDFHQRDYDYDELEKSFLNSNC